MAKYKSQDIPVDASATAVYTKLENPENLKALLSKVPEGADPKMAELGKIEVTRDTISLPAGPVGMLTLRVTERIEPTTIRLQGEGSPIPMSLLLQITPTGDDSCTTRAEIDIDIPMMLKPMVNGPLQKMVDQFGAILGHINFND